MMYVIVEDHDIGGGRDRIMGMVLATEQSVSGAYSALPSRPIPKSINVMITPDEYIEDATRIMIKKLAEADGYDRRRDESGGASTGHGCAGVEQGKLQHLGACLQ